jgi:HD-GYP domain-containing protein (c-di-GMP phosphodiesterase class II)
MIFVPVVELNSGDRLGQHIHQTDGPLVLARGVVLNEHLIDGLVKQKISGVYIDNRRNNGSLPVKQNGMALRQGALEMVSHAFGEIAMTESFQSKPILQMTRDLVHHICKGDDFSMQTKEHRADASYLIGHSVHVCLLSVMTALALDYTEEQLHTLALGALLHDIGYFSPRCANLRKDHPFVGFDLVRQHPDIPLMAAHIVLQHHEQLNGEGYPYAVKGDKFREAAQICAIANDFDHFVNEIGTNRLPHEGIEYIMSKVDSCYSIHLVRAFVSSVIPYPVGTMVRLTNGRVGRVSKLSTSNPSRPVITDNKDGKQINLSQHHTVFVNEVITGTILNVV